MALIVGCAPFSSLHWATHLAPARAAHRAPPPTARGARIVFCRWQMPPATTPRTAVRSRTPAPPQAPPLSSFASPSRLLAS